MRVLWLALGIIGLSSGLLLVAIGDTLEARLLGLMYVAVNSFSLVAWGASHE